MSFDTETGNIPAEIPSESLAASAQALEWATCRIKAAGIETPRLEAQLLLALALKVSRTAVIAGLHPILEAPIQQRFLELVQARLRRIPLAYLRGDQEFYGLPFSVNSETLIPRPETELLVDFAREALGSNTASTLLDVGTGTGCIAISALAHLPSACGIALDLSGGALELARRNASRNGVGERLRFLRSSLLQGVRGELDLILSNPPYIPSREIADLQPEVRDYEPHLALDGGEEGLHLLRELAESAGRVLKPGGWIAVECALGQAGDVAELFAQNGLIEVQTKRDLAGIERVVIGRKQEVYRPL